MGEFAVLLAGLPHGSACPHDERVDFAGVTKALRLALDAQKHVNGVSAKCGLQMSALGHYEDDDLPPENGLKTDQGLRAVLSVLGLGGPLVSGLPRKQQEALVRRTFEVSTSAARLRDGGFTSSETPSRPFLLQSLERLGLPELLRRA